MNNRFLSTGSEKKRQVGRPGFFYFFPNLFFYKLECTERGRKKKFENLKKKKFQSALFSPLGRWTENNSLSKGGLRHANWVYRERIMNALY